MKREKVKQTVRVTERAVTSNDKLVIFDYEKTEDERVKSCSFSIFRNENEAELTANGVVDTISRSINSYFSQEIDKTTITAFKEVLNEMENILEIEETGESEDEEDTNK